MSDAGFSIVLRTTALRYVSKRSGKDMINTSREFVC